VLDTVVMVESEGLQKWYVISNGIICIHVHALPMHSCLPMHLYY